MESQITNPHAVLIIPRPRMHIPSSSFAPIFEDGIRLRVVQSFSILQPKHCIIQKERIARADVGPNLAYEVLAYAMPVALEVARNVVMLMPVLCHTGVYLTCGLVPYRSRVPLLAYRTKHCLPNIILATTSPSRPHCVPKPIDLGHCTDHFPFV